MSSFQNTYSTVTMTTQQTVGTTRQALPNLGGRTTIIQADPGNTTTILYIGDVTVTSAGGGNVMLALPNSAIFMLPVHQSGVLYAVGSAASAKYYVSTLS